MIRSSIFTVDLMGVVSTRLYSLAVLILLLVSFQLPVAGCGFAKQAVDRIELADFGARSGVNADQALQSALRECAGSGRLVHIPSGYWLIHSTASFPQGCAGVVGEGASSVFVLDNYNGAVMEAVVVSGHPFSNVEFIGISVFWGGSKPSKLFDQSRLLLVRGPIGNVLPGDGISWSVFRDLRGIGVHDIVKIDTGTLDQGNGLGLGGFSGWNTFEDIETDVGAEGSMPFAQVYMTQGSSTGNRFLGMTGVVSEAYLRVEGKRCSVGDIIMSSAQVGSGRLLSVGPDTTYRHSIVIEGVQVDSSSSEVLKFEAGETRPSALKITGGSFGGSTPWQDIPPIARSVVSDLGESRWAAGGPIYDLGVPTKDARGRVVAVTRQVWEVDLFDGLTTLDVKVDGIVGGVESGGIEQRFRLAVSATDNRIFIEAGIPHRLGAHSGTQVPAGFPTIAITQIPQTSKILVTTTYKAVASGTKLESTIVGEGGVFKILRGASLTF